MMVLARRLAMVKSRCSFHIEHQGLMKPGLNIINNARESTPMARWAAHHIEDLPVGRQS